MLTLVYFLLAALLAALCIKRRPSVSTWTLAGALAVSALLPLGNLWSIIPFVAAIDAAVCLIMMAVWAYHGDSISRLVCFIGLAKTAASLVQYTHDSYYIGWPYAIFINAAFMAQLLIAGGFADAVGNRFDRLLAGIHAGSCRIILGSSNPEEEEVTVVYKRKNGTGE